MPDDDLVIRASPRTLLTFALAPGVGAIVVFILVSAALHRSHLGWAFGAAAAWWLVHIPFVLRARARFTAASVDARNAFRSYSARWEEIRAIRVVPGLWYSYDTSWTRMLEVETRDGRRFTLRGCTKLRQRTVDELERLLRERARQYGFEVPDSLAPIHKASWAP
jgi:Bacterial PH domain